jgi:LDH2 family malate/lactate/ureidoglycolate dehydrogenase
LIAILLVCVQYVKLTLVTHTYPIAELNYMFTAIESTLGVASGEAHVVAHSIIDATVHGGASHDLLLSDDSKERTRVHTTNQTSATRRCTVH